MTFHHSRLALFLFAVYLVLYGGFVLLSAFAPAVMESQPLFGVSLAVTYGFGLIAAAFVLSLIYGWWGGAAAEDGPRAEGSREGGSR